MRWRRCSRHAARFPNFLLFKDGGGADEVASPGLMPGGIVLLRGAEGDYARWHAGSGGPYEGFLLSAANAFPTELAAVLGDLRGGRVGDARRRSAALPAVVADAFTAVASMPQGNAFNANQAFAHVMALRRRRVARPAATAPRLHAGAHLPRRAMRKVVAFLERRASWPALGCLRP